MRGAWYGSAKRVAAEADPNVETVVVDAREEFADDYVLPAILANARYGGNTACVTVEAPGTDPIIFDLGTGLRFYGESLPTDAAPFRGLALVTHMHWDHVANFTMFPNATTWVGERELAWAAEQPASVSA